MAGFLGQFVGRMENHLDITFEDHSRAYEINPVLRAYGLPGFVSGDGRIGLPVEAVGCGQLYKCLGLGLKASKRIGKEITPEVFAIGGGSDYDGAFP